MLTRRRLLKGLASACAAASMAWSPLATVALPKPRRIRVTGYDMWGKHIEEQLSRAHLEYARLLQQELWDYAVAAPRVLRGTAVGRSENIRYVSPHEDHDDGGPPGPSDGLRPDS